MASTDGFGICWRNPAPCCDVWLTLHPVMTWPSSGLAEGDVVAPVPQSPRCDPPLSVIGGIRKLHAQKGQRF